jgi:hypothetical protein
METQTRKVLGTWYQLPCGDWHYEPGSTGRPDETSFTQWAENCEACES